MWAVFQFLLRTTSEDHDEQHGRVSLAQFDSGMAQLGCVEIERSSKRQTHLGPVV